MINRSAAADILEEIALLKRLAGEGEFKASAFEKAAWAILRLEDFDIRLRRQSLAEVQGIGISSARIIQEYARTGTCTMLEELRASVDPVMVQWTAIPGLGPKKVRTLYTELNIRNMQELAIACADGRVAGLPGFGEKSAARLLKSVQWLLENSSRLRANEADALLQGFVHRLEAVSGVHRMEAVGSIRRGMETIGTIRILAGAEGSTVSALLQAFTTHPDVKTITNHGPTMASVLMPQGLPAELYIVSPDHFEAARLWYTGSCRHLARLHSLAAGRGMAVREQGLFKLDSDQQADLTQPIASPTEIAIYDHLGLAWIPPERREGENEVEEYPRGASPPLIEEKHIRGIMHLHTTWSDGSASIEEMAEACIQRGYEWMIVTDHSQAAAYAGGLSVERLIRQERDIAEINMKYTGRFRVLHGIEADILADGSLDYPPEVLNNLDWVIGSVHSRLDMPQDEMLQRLIRAMKNPLCCVIGHPTGRLLGRREGCPLDMDALCEEALRNQIAIEINADPWRLDLDWRPALRARPHGLLTSINPDAHSVPALDHIRYGLNIARKAGFPPQQVMCTWTADDLLRWRFKRKEG